MFDIFINTHFSSGHHLRNYPGNCEFPHGHNWNVKVTIRADSLDELGMGVDFRTAKNAVKKIIDDLDHTNLNDHPSFQQENPSSENIAVHIFQALGPHLTTDHYRVYSVTVEETPGSGVTYYGN